jgi:hypothetical protein
MQQFFKVSTLVVLCSISLFSCTKKDNPDVTPDPTGTGSVKLEFSNKVGSSNLTLNDQWYMNEHGDSFKVSKFNYYISNVKLNSATASYTENESYHLVQQGTAGSGTFDLANVPYGTYTGVTLMIGVDSLRNVSGAQTGALDPTNDMFWTWNTGYIMVKFEGVSPKSPASGGKLVFHAGGFKGDYATQRTVTLNFASPITVAKNAENHVHIDADVLQLFKSPNVLDFSVTYSFQMAGVDGKNFADNYANMFSVSYSGL